MMITIPINKSAILKKNTRMSETQQAEIVFINNDLEVFDATFNFVGKTEKEVEEELVLARQIHEIYYPLKKKYNNTKEKIEMKINKTYNQKQNPKWFFLLGIAFVGIYLIIYYVWNQHTWLLIPITILLFVKAFKIQKNPVLPAVSIDEEGMYVHFKKAKYTYSEIAEIKLGSKYKDGYIVLKSTGKKVPLNSVAMSLEDQAEIQSVVQRKITFD